MCSKGCCNVGEILYGGHGPEEQELEEIMENNVELEKYPAFQEMFAGGGHPNYALTAYCVEIGHVECLRTLSTLPYFMYHSDLAIVAAECDQLECLQFIIQVLGKVDLPARRHISGPNCKEYITQLNARRQKRK